MSGHRPPFRANEAVDIVTHEAEQPGWIGEIRADGWFGWYDVEPIQPRLAPH